MSQADKAANYPTLHTPEEVERRKGSRTHTQLYDLQKKSLSDTCMQQHNTSFNGQQDNPELRSCDKGQTSFVSSSIHSSTMT